MFTDVFGESPQTKILDFLADHPDYDYSISEISKHSLVSRPTVYKVLEVLLEKKLVLKTREQGTSFLYKLNVDTALVKILLRFDFELAKKTAEAEEKKTRRKDTSLIETSVHKKTGGRASVPA